MTDQDRDADEAPPPNQAASAAAVEDNPQVFVLARELAEVHLLLDNISSDPDTTISALSTREPLDGIDKEWIDRVCEISWPPTPAAEKARQAALLIRAKDYLNRLAKPASGASIAFTHLVTQDERDPNPRDDRQPGVDVEEVHSRRSLSELAFPDFAPRARRFRKALRLMNISLIAILLITCLISWYVAFGNSTLGEYAAAQKRLAAAQARVDSLEMGVRPGISATAGATGDTPQATAAVPAGTASTDGGAAGVDAGIAYCDRWTVENRPNGKQVRRYANAEQRQACMELEEAEKQRKTVEARLKAWLLLRDQEIGAAAIAAHVASIIGTAALPVLYGILGAGAAVLRSISHRIKASTLSPRDFNLSMQQLALGAVIGACIGLFIVQPGAEQALIGPVALSISAISFIAGFGVEAVFQALEALISRIFNVAPAATSRADPRER